MADTHRIAPSGQGKHSPVPPEIERWSWGAFLLNWIWGLGNNTPIALLMFVPGVNLVLWFVLGLRGNRWAWQNKTWRSVEDFQRIQRVWTVFGALLWAMTLAVVGVAFVLFLLFGNLMRTSAPVTMALERLQNNPQAVALLGEPIKPGFPMGSLIQDGVQGCALLHVSVTGSRAEGTIYIDATRDFGKWRLNRLELETDENAPRLNLAPEATGPAQVGCHSKKRDEF